jgi:hypothetical protein
MPMMSYWYFSFRFDNTSKACQILGIEKKYLHGVVKPRNSLIIMSNDPGPDMASVVLRDYICEARSLSPTLGEETIPASFMHSEARYSSLNVSLSSQNSAICAEKSHRTLQL